MSSKKNSGGATPTKKKASKEVPIKVDLGLPAPELPTKASPESDPSLPPPVALYTDAVGFLASMNPTNPYLEDIVHALISDTNTSKAIWRKINGLESITFIKDRLHDILKDFPNRKAMIDAFDLNLDGIDLADKAYCYSKNHKCSKIQEAIANDGKNPIDVFNEMDPRSDLAAHLRFCENRKILNIEALKDLYRRNYENRTTVTPSINRDWNIEDYAKDMAVKVETAFLLLPHSERFMELVLDLYSALSAEAEGAGEVVVTNKSKLKEVPMK